MPAVPSTQAASGPVTLDDDAGVERQLRGDGVGAAGGDGDQRRPDQTPRRSAASGASRRADERSRARPASPARSQRVAVQRRPDRVRLNLGPGHQVAAARRRGVEILQARRRRADDDDLAAEDAGRHAAAQHLPERDAAERAGPAAVVDQRVAVRELATARAASRRALRGDDGEALEAGDLVREVRDHAARRGRQVGGRRPRVHLREVRVAPEDVGVALRVALAGRERRRRRRRRWRRRAPDPAPVRARLGELDVVDDLARAGRVQAVDHARVERARERPRLPSSPNDASSIVTITMSVGRRHVPQLEPRGETRALERVERTGQLGEPGKRKRRRRRPRSRPRTAPACQRHGWCLPKRAVRGRESFQACEVLVPARTMTVTLRTRSRTATVPLRHPDERARTGVAREPGGAAHGRDGRAPAGDEATVVVLPPELAHARLLRRRRGRVQARLRAAQRRRQREHGRRPLAARLAEREGAAPEASRSAACRSSSRRS